MSVSKSISLDPLQTPPATCVSWWNNVDCIVEKSYSPRHVAGSFPDIFTTFWVPLSSPMSIYNLGVGILLILIKESARSAYPKDQSQRWQQRSYLLFASYMGTQPTANVNISPITLLNHTDGISWERRTLGKPSRLPPPRLARWCRPKSELRRIVIFPNYAISKNENISLRHQYEHPVSEFFSDIQLMWPIDGGFTLSHPNVPLESIFQTIEMLWNYLGLLVGLLWFRRGGG